MTLDMNAAQDYWIIVETSSQPVRALHNALLLEESDKALVMHKTGFWFYHCFPCEEVAEDLLLPSERRTFYPL